MQPPILMVMGQILSDFYYFSRRVQEEIARSKRGNTRFGIVVLTSVPADAELPEIACVRNLPTILAGVRETDCVSRIGRDTIAILLTDADGDGARSASLRLFERIGGDASRWSVRVLEWPDHESILIDLGIAA